MTKSELAKAIIFKHNITSVGEKRLIEATVDDVFDILLRKIVADGEVKLARFGTFSVFSFKEKPRVAFYQSTRLGELLRRAGNDNGSTP